jgi:hypothetical protein
MFSDVSEVFPASVTRTHRTDGGGSKHLSNVSKLLPDYMAQHPKRQPTSPCFFGTKSDTPNSGTVFCKLFIAPYNSYSLEAVLD